MPVQDPTSLPYPSYPDLLLASNVVKIAPIDIYLFKVTIETPEQEVESL